MTGALLALAYPDRIGRRRPGTAGRYLLSGGRGAALPEGDPMANEEFLVVADLDGSTQDVAHLPRRTDHRRGDRGALRRPHRRRGDRRVERRGGGAADGAGWAH